jgi:hypothetical protein
MPTPAQLAAEIDKTWDALDSQLDLAEDMGVPESIITDLSTALCLMGKAIRDLVELPEEVR